MRSDKLKDTAIVNCSTCRHSQFKHGNVHVCTGHERGGGAMAVAGDYQCENWRSLTVTDGQGRQKRFGELCACPLCAV